jgi:hypothetical protein
VAYDRFGWSVSISKDTAIVGVYGDDDNGNDSSSAYVFATSEAKLLTGLGTYTTNGGWMEIFDYNGGDTSKAWAHINWSAHNSANGET